MRAILLLLRSVRTSCIPSPIDLHVGIPTGQPNSTVLMSSPMQRLSFASSDFNHSRSGSLPAFVLKKTAGIRFVGTRRGGVGPLIVAECTLRGTSVSTAQTADAPAF